MGNIISKKLSSNIFIFELIRSIVVGFITGIILGFADFYIGILFFKMSYATYFGFWAAYITGSIILSILVQIYVKLFIKSNNRTLYYYTIYFTILLLLTDFVYLNTKLLGGFEMLKFKAIIINVLLLAVIWLLYKFIIKIEKKQELFSDIWGYLQVSVLVFNLTAIFNCFVLYWPSTPESFLKIISMFILTMAIPFVIIVILNNINKFFTRLLKNRIMSIICRLSIVLLLMLIIPLGLKFPNFSSFENADYQHDVNQTTNLKEKPNVIWIVLDTARRDVFSCYGYNRETTPYIDKFSEDGVLFTNYFSTASWTFPSHASMFTGMYPSKHGANSCTVDALPFFDGHTTIAEVLKDNGYNTGAVVANYGQLSRERNFDQGFNFYFSESSQFHYFFWGLICSNFYPEIREKGKFRINKCRLSAEINNVALRWVKQNRTNPFFLFLNYMEPHDGFLYLPDSYNHRFVTDWGEWSRIHRTINKSDIVHKRTNITKEQRQTFIDWVDCKLAYLDYNIGKLFASLKELGLYDNSFIIVVSDHGDLFGEHNSFGHTTEIYNELIWVPLIIKYPKDKNKVGIVDDTYVQSVDLMPEILKYLDVPVPEDVQGQPIDSIDHEIIAEYFSTLSPAAKLNPERYDRDLKAIISHDDMNLKYIHSSKDSAELYNLTNDPYELYNVISEMSADANSLDERLQNWIQSFESFKKDKNKNKKKISKKLKEKLKALGYIN